MPTTVTLTATPTWAVITTALGLLLGGVLLGRGLAGRKIADLEDTIEAIEAWDRAPVIDRHRLDRTSDSGFARLPAARPAAPAEPILTDTGAVLLSPIPVQVPWYQRPLISVLGFWDSTAPRDPVRAALAVEPDWEREFDRIVAAIPQPPVAPSRRDIIAGTATGSYPVLVRDGR